MADKDFVFLTRKAINSHYPKGEYPGKDTRSQEFWRSIYTTLGFKFEKKTRDSKRPIETLAKLEETEFAVICEIFEQRPNIKASAITKDLQGIKEKEKRLELLQAFLINKNAFRVAAIKAKGKTVSVDVKDGAFYINQGRKRIEACDIVFAHKGKTFQLTPTKAIGLISTEMAGIPAKCMRTQASQKRNQAIHKISEVPADVSGSNNRLAQGMLTSAGCPRSL